MKVSYTSKDGKMVFEIEGDTQAEIWRQISRIQEVFEAGPIRKNGVTSDDIRFVVRTDDEDNEYFELQYRGDDPKLFGVKKTFGQYKTPKGALFPRSKSKTGEWLPDNGWVKYNKETGMEE